MVDVKIIKATWLFRFFMPGIAAFTIKPYIFIKNKEYSNDETLLYHEYAHILQQRELGLIKFLFLYFYYYFMNLIKYRDLEKAYLMIPFEIEAYASEREIGSLDIRKFHWQKYINYNIEK